MQVTYAPTNDTGTNGILSAQASSPSKQRPVNQTVIYGHDMHTS